MAGLKRLYGSTTYLVGAMDRTTDNGEGWRNNITPFLEDLGIIVLNPCNKPIDIGLENIETRQYRQSLKDTKNWQKLSEEMKLLRIVDLRMTDRSDMIIVNLDTSIHACGTYEEIFWANRMKKPILIHCEQGIQGLPDWLFGVLPYQFFFDSWKDLKTYILDVHTKEKVKHYKRWIFFNYKELLPK